MIARLISFAQKQKPFDTYFFWIVVIISGIGLLSFISASLGILARSEEKFYGVLFNQIVLGLVGGFLALWVCSLIPYSFWRKYSFYIFIGAVLLTLAVFIPGIGFEHGGARRWISVGSVSFQPAEFLKVAFVMYFSAWLTWTRKKEGEVLFKIVPLIIILGIVGVALLRQPDTKSVVLSAISACALLFVSGVSWKKIALIVFGAVAVVGILAYVRPYVRERIQTFIDPSRDPQGSSYQLQQSLIAIGSGGVIGRGLGQSVQKFSYLPEPQGDSIFAVIGEEFGFIGTTILIILYIFFAVRGFKIALRAPDTFSRYLVVGLVTLLLGQSFLNILSLVGLFPLTGVPLVFISHGGTALMIALAMVGIILNVSRNQKTLLQ